jgi:hypothetical protein
MWVAAEAHLIFVGYVDVGRVTRSRPTCIVIFMQTMETSI